MKVVLDSSTVISLADNCLLWVVKDLKKEGIEFIIPPGVVYESVERPSSNIRFALNALRIKRAIDEGTLIVFKKDGALKNYIRQVKKLANSIFYIHGRPIELIHHGEAEALAVLALTDADIIAIDERTTRQLVETPNLIRESLERTHMAKIKMDEKKLKELYNLLEDVYIIRSVEVIAMAYEKGILRMDKLNQKDILKAALYAVKFGGCSVSFDEIEEYLVKA